MKQAKCIFLWALAAIMAMASTVEARPLHSRYVYRHYSRHHRICPGPLCGTPAASDYYGSPYGTQRSGVAPPPAPQESGRVYAVPAPAGAPTGGVNDAQ